MRKAGSTFEWSFTGGNEIACGIPHGPRGRRLHPRDREKGGGGRAADGGYPRALCARVRRPQPQLPDRTRKRNASSGTRKTLRGHGRRSRSRPTARASRPSSLAAEMMDFAEDRAGFRTSWCPASSTASACSATNGALAATTARLLTGRTRITNTSKRSAHLCHAVCCPDENIGFRYENPILLSKNGCEYMSKFPLAIEVIE